MKALRWHGREDVRVDDVPEPEANGETLVAVSRCGICGTDLAEYRHGPLMIDAAPVTLGHELSGVVVAGALKAGTRVVVDPRLRCGDCPECRRGDVHLCRRGAAIGLHRDGGLAPLLTVPGYGLIPIPDTVTDEEAALSEPLAVALHGLGRGGLTPGSSVVVLGFGPIGAGTAVLARALGATCLVVELDPGRRAVADALGFATLDAGADLARRVRRHLGDHADLVMESTGVAPLVAEAVRMAGRGRAVVLLGLPKIPADLDVRALVMAERSLIGSMGYVDEQPRVLELLTGGELDVTALISETVGLSDAGTALADLARAPGGRIKLLVDPSR